jgi:hypothetical protein
MPSGDHKPARENFTKTPGNTHRNIRRPKEEKLLGPGKGARTYCVMYA